MKKTTGKKELKLNKGILPGKEPSWRRTDLLPLLLIAAYVAVDFIPGSNTSDVMGNQWLYLSFVNLGAILVITLSKNNFTGDHFRSISRTALSVLILALFIIAGISVLFAANKIEFLVCYARLVNTVLMYFCLAILLYERLNIFKLLAQVLAIILLFQSVSLLSAFFKGMGEMNISTLIYSLKGNSANKNIMAAGLVLKLPFVIYCICTAPLWRKILNALILICGGLAIFIINARSAYLGMIAQVLIFLVLFLVITYRKDPIKQTIFKVSLVLVPMLISFFLSQAVIRNAIRLQDDKTPYGTVVQRLGSISFTSEGSNARLSLWSSAVDYIKNHPVVGAGYGNWKLASIPYEKTFVDDLLVTYHVHNDFLEITSETGVLGGFIFLAIFACAAFYGLKTILTRVDRATAMISLTALLALAGYFVDASFNFPMERPVMQFFFALTLAVSLNSYLAGRKKGEEKEVNRHGYRKLFAVLGLLFLLPALYTCFLTYKSLIAQTKVNRDMMSQAPQTNWEEIKDIFPPVPNINMYCFPIDDIKAFYLIKDKKYSEALAWLDKGATINPHLTLTEFLKAKIYLETGNGDSCFVYAKKAFFNKPRARSNYEMLNDICIQRMDSLTLTDAFNEYKKYRNEPWAWNRYLGIMISMLRNRAPLVAMTEQALRLFPNDAELIQKRDLLSNPQSLPVTTAQDTEFRKYFAVGLDAFNNKNYSVAIENFTKAAAANPNDYVAIENIGVCYYSRGEYARAIQYFDRVLGRKISTDGKSEFLKGMSLISLSRTPEACTFLRIADQKGYAGSKEQIASYCK